MLSLPRLNRCPLAFLRFDVILGVSKLYFRGMSCRLLFMSRHTSSLSLSSSSDSTIFSRDSRFSVSDKNFDFKLCSDDDESDVSDVDPFDRSMFINVDEIFPLPLTLAVLALLNECFFGRFYNEINKYLITNLG